jgi:hypothetical protein
MATYFFRLEADFLVEDDFFEGAFGSYIHSSLSEVNQPPNPTIISNNGHKFQNSRGTIPILALKNNNPITINERGQKTFLGMLVTPWTTLSIYLSTLLDQ